MMLAFVKVFPGTKQVNDEIKSVRWSTDFDGDTSTKWPQPVYTNVMPSDLHLNLSTTATLGTE